METNNINILQRVSKSKGDAAENLTALDLGIQKTESFVFVFLPKQLVSLESWPASFCIF